MTHHRINAPQNLRREIKSTDREIDRLVYRMYGTTEKEIRIVKAG